MNLALAARRAVAVTAVTGLLTGGGVATGLLSSAALAAGSTVSSATPAVVDNTGATPVTINGAGFTPQFDTVDFVPQFASAVSLASVKATVDTANSTATALKISVAGTNAAPGTYDIRVVQSGLSSGTTTCSKCFTIVGDPASVSGSSGGASTGSTSRGYRALDIAGSNLAKGSFVRFYKPDNTIDSALTFTPGDPNNTGTQGYVSSTLIRGNYAAASGYTPGRHLLRVTNTDGGTGTTSDFYQPDFTAAGVSPSSLGQGAQQQTVTVTGAGFRAGSLLLIQDLDTSSASDITVGAATVNGAGTTISAPVTVRGNATTGTGRTVTVVGPDGGVLSVSSAFRVNAGPGLTSLNVTALGQGAVQDVVVNGSGFATGGTSAATRPLFTFDGTGVTAVTKAGNSATSATITITVTGNAPVGGRSVTVTNPDGGRATLAPTTTPVIGTTYPFNVHAGPQITSVSPSSTTPGNSSPAITVKGKNFDATNGMTFSFLKADGTPDSAFAVGTVTVTDGGSADDTATFTPTITGATAGLRTVVATNKGDFGSTSCAGCFGIDQLGVSPVGGTNTAVKSIAITGSGFDATSTAKLVRSGTQTYQAPIVGSTPVVTNGGTLLTADFDLTGVAPGPYNMVVTTGTGNTAVTTSCSGCFTVTAAAPTLTSVTPSSGGQGATGLAVTLAGTNFWPGETVTVSGTGVTVRDVTVVSTTQITALLDVADGATTGARDVTVRAADGVQSATKTGGFTVTSAPTLSGISPAALGQGAVSQTVTLTGDGIDQNLTAGGVDLGPGTTVTSVVVTQGNGLTTHDTVAATVSVAQGAATTTRDVVLTNPDGGQATLPQAFTVNPGPQVLSVSPVSLAPSKSGQTLTITGSGFASNAVPTIAGVTLTSPTVSADGTTLTATAATDATTGQRDVTVTNGTDHGVGTCTGCLYVATAPGAPTNVAVDTTQPDSLVVTWTAPADNGGAPITSYNVSAYTLNGNGTTGAPAGTPADTSGSATTGTVTGLTPGVTYRVFVVARNVAGQSTPQDATGTGTVVGAPSAPVVHATPGDAKVTITWSGSTANGSPITGYQLVIGNAAPVTVSASTSTYTFTGLTNGLTYTASVKGVNGYGTGPAGTASAKPRFATKLTSTHSPTSSVAGQKVRFSGRLTRVSSGAPIAGARITFVVTPDVGKQGVGYPVTDANGYWAFDYAPSYNLTVRAAWPGDNADTGVTATAYRHGVAPRLTVSSPQSGATTSASTNLTVKGSVSPNKAGALVYLSRYANGSWVTFAQARVLSDGTYTIVHSLARGDYYLRTSIGQTTGNTRGYSAVFVSHRR